MVVQIGSTVDGTTTFECVGNNSVHGARWTLDGVEISATDEHSDSNYISRVMVECGSGNELECCLRFTGSTDSEDVEIICGSRYLYIDIILILIMEAKSYC